MKNPHCYVEQPIVGRLQMSKKKKNCSAKTNLQLAKRKRDGKFRGRNPRRRNKINVFNNSNIQ